LTKPLSTDVAIRKWRPETPGEARSTGGRDGLYIRGWPSGQKAFYFRSGTWLKIADYPDIGLATARELAVVAKRLKKEGFANSALKRGFTNARTGSNLEAIVRGEVLAGLSHEAMTKVPTYNQMWDQWFADVEPTLQEGPSRRRPRAIQELHVAPTLGERPVNEIRRREIYELLHPLFRDKPITAGHALGHIKKVFELAIVKEFCENNPTPPRSSFPKNVRKKKPHGTIAAKKLPELWAWVSTTNASQSVKTAILTAMVTAHRIGVIVNIRWADIDLEKGIWQVPERQDRSTPGRMKSGRPYSLRLPPRLIERLKALRLRSTGNYVFESPTTKGPVTPNAVLKLLKSYDMNLTTHGFRNAVKEFCRQAIPRIPDDIADAYCDHSLKGLDASYRRIDTSDERAALAERLFSHVTGAP
jgi:integrase